MTTVIGLTHAYAVTGSVIDYLMIWEQSPPIEATLYRAYDIAAGYLFMALIFLGLGFYHDRQKNDDVDDFIPHA